MTTLQQILSRLDPDEANEFLGFWANYRDQNNNRVGGMDAWNAFTGMATQLVGVAYDGAFTTPIVQGRQAPSWIERTAKKVGAGVNIIKGAKKVKDWWKGEGEFSDLYKKGYYGRGSGPQQTVNLNMGPQFDPMNTIDIGEQMYIDSVRDRGDDYLPGSGRPRLFTTKTEIKKNDRIKELKRYTSYWTKQQIFADSATPSNVQKYGRIIQIGNIPQGTTKSTRIGNRVFLKYFQISVVLNLRHGLPTGTIQWNHKKYLKLSLVFDKYPDTELELDASGEEDLINDIWPDEESGGFTDMQILQWKTQEYGPNDRFIILMDKMLEYTKDDDYLTFKWEKQFKGLSLNYSGQFQRFPIRGQLLLYFSADTLSNCSCGQAWHTGVLNNQCKYILHYT